MSLDRTDTGHTGRAAIPAPAADRRPVLDRILAELVPGRRVVLSTHVNADGDGAGSETALAHWLVRRGLHPTIVNPTPFPDEFGFLLGDVSCAAPSTPEGRTALAAADLVLVVDTAEPSRLGAAWEGIRERPVIVLDHHPPVTPDIGDPALRDPTACATGELAYDLIRAAGDAVRLAEANALYVAIVTDTGSFRFSNASPRAHEIAAELLRTGVDPEEMYRRLFANYTPQGLELLRRALATLQVHPDISLAWIRLTEADLQETGADREDLEGIVEFPRRVRGVSVAAFLRGLPDGRTKVSLRAMGSIDVADVARRLGGGGHPKAAGAVMELDLDAAEGAVVDAVRSAIP